MERVEIPESTLPFPIPGHTQTQTGTPVAVSSAPPSFVVTSSRCSILGEGLVEINVRWWWALLGECSGVPENTVPQIN